MELRLRFWETYLDLVWEGPTAVCNKLHDVQQVVICPMCDRHRLCIRRRKDFVNYTHYLLGISVGRA